MFLLRVFTSGKVNVVTFINYTPIIANLMELNLTCVDSNYFYAITDRISGSIKTEWYKQ